MKMRERERERKGGGEEEEGGGNDIAHAYCCLLLSHGCGGWLSTHTCTHPNSDHLNNTQRQNEKKAKKEMIQPQCATLCSEFSRAHHELLLF